MTFTAAQQLLIDRVESRIDEITPQGQTPTVSHNTIWAELEDAANYVLEIAPPDIAAWAASDSTADANINFANNAYATVVNLEEEVIRVLRVKCDGWRKPVDDILPPSATPQMPGDGATYRRQTNPYQGSTQGSPGAHLVPKISGNRRWALECYPLDPDASPIEELIVVKTTTPDSIPDTAGGRPLYDAMIWEAAGRALLFIKQSQFGRIASANAMVRLGLQPPDIKQARES